MILTLRWTFTPACTKSGVQSIPGRPVSAQIGSDSSPALQRVLLACRQTEEGGREREWGGDDTNPV